MVLSRLDLEAPRVAARRDGHRVGIASRADSAADVVRLTSELEEGDSGLRNVAALAFSPDGQLLATGSAAGLQVWNWADAALIAEMRRPVSSGLRFASQTRLEFVLEPPMGEARASESALGELGVFNWWGVKPAALAWDLSLLSLPSRLSDRMRLPGGERINDAIALLDDLTHADELADFLTLAAYERID